MQKVAPEENILEALNIDHNLFARLLSSQAVRRADIIGVDVIGKHKRKETLGKYSAKRMVGMSQEEGSDADEDEQRN
jgi:hypothetical protein